MPPQSSASLKQRHPREAPPSSSATLKQHKYWFRQPTHPFIYLTLDHAKTNMNTKTTNKTTTRRRTRKTKQQTRCPHNDKHENKNNERDTHAKMNPTHRNSTRQHQIIEQIMAPASSQRCWRIKETAKPQKVPMPHNYEKRDGTITLNMPSKGCARYCISNHPRGCCSAGIHTT